MFMKSWFFILGWFLIRFWGWVHCTSNFSAPEPAQTIENSAPEFYSDYDHQLYQDFDEDDEDFEFMDHFEHDLSHMIDEYYTGIIIPPLEVFTLNTDIPKNASSMNFHIMHHDDKGSLQLRIHLDEKIIPKRVITETSFSVNVTNASHATLDFSNEKRKPLYLHLMIGFMVEQHSVNAKLDSMETRLFHIFNEIRNVQGMAKFVWTSQHTRMEKSKSAKRQAAAVMFAGVVCVVLVSIIQIYYLKHLVSDKRVI